MVITGLSEAELYSKDKHRKEAFPLREQKSFQTDLSSTLQISIKKEVKSGHEKEICIYSDI